MQKLLIVDDDTPIAEGLAALFEGEQIATVSASGRELAEELIGSEFFPVIIADVRLRTEEEGLRLLESIRSLSPRSKVASLTGYATPALEAELKARGAELVLYKPVDFADLLRVVRELLGAVDEVAPADLAGPVNVEELYGKLRSLLHSLPRRRYGLDFDETEEIVQQAWCLFLENQSVIRQPKSWLAGTVVNLCRRQLQQKVRKRESETDISSGDELLAAPVDHDAVLAVRQALARVDSRTRTLCQLIGMEKHSYEDVSRNLDLPIGSIGPLYIRAKAKLREAMKQTAGS